jgi:hypothetical protein
MLSSQHIINMKKYFFRLSLKSGCTLRAHLSLHWSHFKFKSPAAGVADGYSHRQSRHGLLGDAEDPRQQATLSQCLNYQTGVFQEEKF